MKKLVGRRRGLPASPEIQLAASEALARWDAGVLQRLTGLRRGTLAAIVAGLPVQARTAARAKVAFENLGWSTEHLAYMPRLAGGSPPRLAPPACPEPIGAVIGRLLTTIRGLGEYKEGSGE